MDERTLINTFFDRPQGRTLAGRHDVVRGIGDDGAIVRPAPGLDLVIAMDTIVEGTHFPAGIAAAAVGHRCLAVNLSDLAAMAAEPLWCTLALSLPAADPAWVGDFARGLFALADRHGLVLVGGDTVRGPLGATVTVVGQVRPGDAVRRSGARPGDGIWVTGHPGDAMAGRLLLADATTEGAATTLRKRFLYPEPRVREGRLLAGMATAMLDISDGLDDDLRKLLEASQVGGQMDAESLPLSSESLRLHPGKAVEYALTGGDDYELCFTVPASRESDFRERAATWEVPVTRIGTVVPGSGSRWLQHGRQLAVPDTTFRHF